MMGAMRARTLFTFCCYAGLLFVSEAFVRAEEVVLLQFQRSGKLLPPVVIGLYEADAPRHVANFKRLVKTGFYKKTAIHRVAVDRLVQMGDPLSRVKDSPDIGTGGPGYTLDPEVKHRHTEGSVGMGRLPDRINPLRLSNGSQFYVALKPLSELDGTDTVFGRVERGLEVLTEISRAPVDTNDVPVEPVTVRRAGLVAREKLESEIAGWSRATGQNGSWWVRKFGKFWPF
jgi:peptidyl-prolyl cis-trans isomerase B (cyclophilin B)